MVLFWGRTWFGNEAMLAVEHLEALTPFRGRIYPPSWRGRFPHLMPLDQAIWRRFLDVHGGEFLGYQYDITLGEGAEPLSNFNERDRRLLWMMTVKRADCLCIRPDALFLVEVKPRLGMAAVGQLVTYKALWERQFPGSPPVRMMWVGERGEPDQQYVMDRLGFVSVIV